MTSPVSARQTSTKCAVLDFPELALHEAEYPELAGRLGAVLDLGPRCGLLQLLNRVHEPLDAVVLSQGDDGRGDLPTSTNAGSTQLRSRSPHSLRLKA